MSVVTGYELSAKDKNGNTIDLVERLRSDGTFTETGRETSFGKEVIFGTVDIDKMNHETWQKELEHIKDIGVQTFAEVNDEYCKRDYMKNFMDISIPQERVFSGFGTKDSRSGYYTRNKNFDPESVSFTEFSEEQINEIAQGTQQVRAMYKPETDKETFRRDYNPKEIGEISHPYVHFMDNKMFYSRNYDPYCDYIGFHTAASLTDCISKFEACTEGKHDYTCFWKGAGSETTACGPDGEALEN